MHIDTAKSVVGQINKINLYGGYGRRSQGINHSYIGSSQATVTISTFSKQINEFYQSLQNIQDPEARWLATEGLTAMIGSLSDDPDTAFSSDFMVNMQSLYENDSALFRDFFITAGELNEGGYNLNGFSHIFIAIEYRSLQRSFIQQTQVILHDESEDHLLKQEMFGEFLDATNRVLSSGLEEGQLHQTMEDFLNQVNELDDLESKQSYAANFEVDR